MRRVSQNTEEGVEEGVTKVEALLSWLGVSHCHSITGRGRQLVVWDVIKTFPTLALIQRLHNLSHSTSTSGCNGLALNIFFSRIPSYRP